MIPGDQQGVPQQTPQAQQTSHKTSPRPSNFSDGSGPLFNMYMKTAEEEDDKMADLWQNDAKTILIFASAIRLHTPVVMQPLT